MPTDYDALLRTFHTRTITVVQHGSVMVRLTGTLYFRSDAKACYLETLGNGQELGHVIFRPVHVVSHIHHEDYLLVVVKGDKGVVI